VPYDIALTYKEGLSSLGIVEMTTFDFDCINSRDHRHSNAGPDGSCGKTHYGFIEMLVLEMRVMS